MQSARPVAKQQAATNRFQTWRNDHLCLGGNKGTADAEQMVCPEIENPISAKPPANRLDSGRNPPGDHQVATNIAEAGSNEQESLVAFEASIDRGELREVDPAAGIVGTEMPANVPQVGGMQGRIACHHKTAIDRTVGQCERGVAAPVKGREQHAAAATAFGAPRHRQHHPADFSQRRMQGRIRIADAPASPSAVLVEAGEQRVIDDAG